MPLARFLIDREVITQEQAEQAQRHMGVVGGSLPDTLVALDFAERGPLDKILNEPPEAPDTLEDVGLDAQMLLQLVLKTMYMTGLEKASTLSERIKLGADIVDTILQDAKDKKLVGVLGSAGDIHGELRFELTDLGREWALDALEQSRYVGPAPVPLGIYTIQVMKQSLEGERISMADLDEAMAHLVLAPDVLKRLGPAVSSGRSILLFGPSGNGKTSVAEAIPRAFHSTVYIPYCVEVDRQIITLFDPALHKVAPPTGDEAANENIDPRWVRCQRPVVITGGELTLEMLDLTRDPYSGCYEAPAHVKATGGVFIIDDFGRQRVKPAELLNRWIMPLERRVELLTLHTGRKLQFPFDQLVIFSTNFPPRDLMDEAALRRVQYKFRLAAPTPADYTKILQRVCRAHGLQPPTKELMTYLFRVFYPQSGAPLSAYHPRFIVEHVVARCAFDGKPAELSVELAREALLNMVVTKVPEVGQEENGENREPGAPGAPADS